MTDIVLIRPGFTHKAERHWNLAPPLGLGYLASSLLNDGISVDVVDAKLLCHKGTGQTVKEIIKLDPSFVGLTAMSIELASAHKIAGQVKSKLPQTYTILGGPHANALPIESLIELNHFDYLITGESEKSLMKLVNSNDVKSEQIEGLYYRNRKGDIEQSSPPNYCQNIEDLPFPAWNKFPKCEVYPIMADRGCPFKCVFCSQNMSKKIRTRSNEHVLEEIKWLYQDFSPTWIYFEDETFGLNKSKCEELLRLIADFNKDKNIRFKVQTRVDCITDNIAKLMKLAGIEYVELGLESGDQNILDKSGKNITVDQIKNSIRFLKRHNVKTWLNFILGLPGESIQTMEKSLQMAVNLNPDRLSVAIIVAYPGSKIYDWARNGENGYRLTTNDWSRFDKYLSSSVQLDNLSYKVMRRLQIRIYLETYLRNFRVNEFFKFLWRNKSFVLPVIKSYKH